MGNTSSSGRLDDLGPLPQVHPRSIVTQRAKVSFDNAFGLIIDDYQLTLAEILDLLNETAGRFITRAVRREREASGGE